MGGNSAKDKCGALPGGLQEGCRWSFAAEWLQAGRRRQFQHNWPNWPCHGRWFRMLLMGRKFLRRLRRRWHRLVPSVVGKLCAVHRKFHQQTDTAVPLGGNKSKTAMSLGLDSFMSFRCVEHNVSSELHTFGFCWGVAVVSFDSPSILFDVP